MSNTYLFLGGPADGRRVEVADELSVVRIRSARPFDEWEKSVGLALEPQPPDSIYYKTVMHCFGLIGNEIVFTYGRVWEEGQVLYHLLENYTEEL